MPSHRQVPKEVPALTYETSQKNSPTTAGIRFAHASAPAGGTRATR
jgi:hypothetical protein